MRGSTTSAFPELNEVVEILSRLLDAPVTLTWFSRLTTLTPTERRCVGGLKEVA